MTICKFQQARSIIEKLLENGYEAYYVGGAVRDKQLGRAISDIDIATSAIPAEVQKLFKKHIATGIKHGTISVFLNKNLYEVTTFRTDGDYNDFRRPTSVQFVTSLKDDLSRRDFTINALAMDINGNIFDYYGGLRDLNRRIIRAVNDPIKRFTEDALRMIRAVRFQSQLGFSLEQETRDAVKSCAKKIEFVSQERITTEFEKLLMGVAPEKAIDSLIDCGLNKYLFGLNNLLRLNFFGVSKLEEKWALIIVSQNLEADCFLRQWKCSRKMIKKVQDIVLTVNTMLKGDFNSFVLFQVGEEVGFSAEKICRIVLNESFSVNVGELFSALPIKNIDELAISGRDLINWFPKQRVGAWIGELIEKIVKAVLEREIFNDKEQIRQWVMTNKQ